MQRQKCTFTGGEALGGTRCECTSEDKMMFSARKFALSC